MKKLLALLLVLVMVLTLFAGCGQKAETPAEPEATPATPETTEKTEEKEETSVEEAADEAWKEEHPGWLCEEKTTLSVYTHEGQSSNYLPPSNDLWFWQWMEDYTNVHIEWEVVPNADYNTLISAKLASGGKLNDIIMMGGSIGAANDAGTNGMVIDLTPLWDTCFTNTQAYMDELGLPYKTNISNADGSCYALATLNSPQENQIILMFNTLWMEQLGAEVPTSIDELTELLRKMKDAGDLNGNGVDDEIYLTACNLDCLISPLNSAFGLEALAFQRMYAADETGSVYAEYTSENNRALLTYLNDLYEEGLLDPEIAINTMDIISEKVTADRVGVVSMYSSFSPSYGKLTTAGQSDQTGEYYTLGVPLTSEYNDSAYMMFSESYGTFTGISANCENPELAAKWLDTLYADPQALTARCCGEQGTTWEYDENGEPAPIWPTDGTSWTAKHLGCGQITLPHIQTTQQLMFSKGNLPWYLEQYANIRENFEWKNRSVPNMPGLTEEEAELRDMYNADVDAGWKEHRDKFVLGELDTEADWEEYIETMEALGLNEMIQCHQSIYDRTH